MRIINLTNNDLPVLQGVNYVSEGTREKCKKALDTVFGGNPGTVAGRIRDLIQTEAFLRLALGKDSSLVESLHNQDPILLVLSKDNIEVAKAVLDMQIGPEPGTRIPLLIPVESRNRNWYYLGSDTEIKVALSFSVDQNGNITGLSNFIHKTPKITTGEIKFYRWECSQCGFIYDETIGLPDEGIQPYTKWEDIPDSWNCPDCGVSKSDFFMVKM